MKTAKSVLLTLLATLAAGIPATLAAPTPTRPNILFILTEDQGAQMGFVGTAGLQTPHMDSLARSGIYFNNAYQVKMRVKPDEVKLPAFLPDTPVVRKDWAEYLAAIEAADRLVGEGLEALRTSGHETNTMVVFLGDHGPCFQHGKMTLYDLKSDPDEMRNLADSPAARPPRDRLYAALCRWVRDTADPAMHPPPHAKE